MKQINASFGILVFGVCSAMAADAGASKKPSWKISGDLEEACSCRPACPCWFTSKPSRMTCDGVQAVFIQKGRYGKTSLDGLALAQFVQSPEGKSMAESFGNWNFDNVYIDERANDEQRAALKEIAGHLFPPSAKSRNFQFVPIARNVEAKEHSITVGKSGSFAGHLIDGGFAGAPKIQNPPLADPTHRQYQQGQSSSLVYSDSGQGWKYDNSNYMFNRFKVNSKDYEKFEAEMAKKMAKQRM
ncbi:MAG TPA: DUF1326 domain-containing protein [Verrucomicrobiae bacterium]